MRRRRGRWASGAAVGLALAGLAAAGGCRDDLLAPTMGRIEVRLEGASSVEVWLDGEPAGTDPQGLLGPVSAGRHTVAAVRECYETLPSREVEVEVERGGIAVVEFYLEPREFGAALVTATDELTGTPLTGAAILLETAPGTFVDTGKTTPGQVEPLPCGPARFRVRLDDYEESAPVEVRIDTGSTTPVDVQLGPLHGVLAEMMTYVVCPNCPPAVDELQAVHAANPRDFFIIEWHTVENLPLYDARWKEREVYYTGGVTLGWPLVVFQGDGDDMLLGSAASTLAEYWTRAAAALAECGADCPVVLSAEAAFVSGAADSLEVTARLKWRGGQLPGDLVLRWVLTEDEVEAPGNDSPYHAVPRNYREEPISFGAPGEVLVRSATLTVDPAWDLSHLNYVVYVQSDESRKVLAVHGG